MNNPEVTMNNALPKNNLIATERAITALHLFDEVRAMTWRLLNPRVS